MKFSMLLAVVFLASVLYTDAQGFLRRRPRPGTRPGRPGRPGGFSNRKPPGCPQSKRVNLPQSWQIDLALSNDKVINDAVECIRSPNPVCPGLPYGRKLKQVAPDLILFGTCHPCICTPKEQEDAKRLIQKIAEKHPVKFSALYSAINQQRHAQQGRR